MVQVSHPYIGKTIALTRQTFVGKVMSLLFKMSLLSRFVIAFLSRSKHLLISWLWSPSLVILKPKKISLLNIMKIFYSIHLIHHLIGVNI